MRADKRDPVIAALRRFKPTRFAVTVGGDIKVIPLSAKANKWELLLDTLNVLRWSVIEAQNDAGETLGVVDRELENDNDDNTTDADFTDVDKFKETYNVAISGILRVQTATLEQARRMNADANKVFAEMAATMMDGMRAMSEGYQMAIKMTALAASSASPAEGGGEQDAVMRMVQLAVALKGGGSPFGGAPKPPARPPASKAPVHQPRPTNGIDVKPAA